MKVCLALLIILTIFAVRCSCTGLATTGYFLSQPSVRDFLIRTGLADKLSRKASTLYEISNFRYASDQGTDVRKAAMDSYEILEVDPNRSLQKRTGLIPGQVHNYSKEEDRVYSERLFGVLNEMDRNGCVSRLLCEIAAEPKSFGIIGYKINRYLKSVPPVTWNSATFPYLEAFHSGLKSNKDACSLHYETCQSNLRRVMKILWIFFNPINLKIASGF